MRRIFLISAVLLLAVSCNNDHELKNEIEQKDELIDSLKSNIAELKKQKHQIIEEVLSEKMLTIAVLMAQQINGDELDTLLNKYPEKNDIKNINDDSIYLKMQKVLNLASKRCKHFSSVYILLYNQQKDIYEFTVIDSSQPYWRFEYNELVSSRKDRFKRSPGYGLLPKITDENGEWISAFHEIKNSKGERVGILVADVDLGFYRYLLKD